MVTPPRLEDYLCGAVVMFLGVVLPLAVAWSTRERNPARYAGR
jgi:hypothetical protein